MIQSLHHIKEYREELIYPALCQAMEQLDIAKDLHADMKVILKPNLIMAATTANPVTTHPLIIQCMARYLKEHGIRHITLAESPGGLYNAEFMKKIYRTCGMNDLVPLVTLNMDFSAKTVFCPADFVNHSFHIITPICEGDYIINLCKLKTHAMTGYSGGIKNLFGTIPGLEKPQFHYRFKDIDSFSRMLVELAQTVKPQLTVIDGIVAMEGNGPTGGTPYPLGLLFASRDLYTQDYFAARIMGLDPMQISMIRQSVELGLATPDALTLAGDPMPEGLRPFVVPDARKLDFSSHFPGFIQKPLTKIAARLLKSYPQVDPKICIGCGKCAESCPANVIEIKQSGNNGKKASFQKRGCISCFCCQEMCPVKAISVKKAL